MATKQPQFAVGEAVCPRSQGGRTLPELGTIIESYVIANEYRYVLRFENGREEVFFEKELFSIPPAE